MRGIRTIADVDIGGKKLFVRLDLNVPLEGGAVRSDARIRAALPTLRHALDAGAGLVLCSHLGRPKKQRKPELSLLPVGARLSELLGVDVVLADDCVGDGVRALVEELRPGRDARVVLLENLRFHAGEEANDPEFVRRLCEPFDLENDVYVNDAFGACHRAHASVVGVPQRFATRVAGFLLEKELQGLGKVIANPARPFVAVIGGAKVADKLGILSVLLERCDAICIGGAMAYTFLRARGVSVGTSRVEENLISKARDFLDRAEKRKVRVVLPSDHVVADTFAADATPLTVTEPNIPEDKMGLDIGPGSRRAMADVIAGASTVFWNGPMGVFEWEGFARGTFAVAEAVAAASGTTVVGGGDSVAAIEAAGVADEIDHVSTGGGASLELIELGTLPGLDALAG